MCDRFVSLKTWPIFFPLNDSQMISTFQSKIFLYDEIFTARVSASFSLTVFKHYPNIHKLYWNARVRYWIITQSQQWHNLLTHDKEFVTYYFDKIIFGWHWIHIEYFSSEYKYYLYRLYMAVMLTQLRCLILREFSARADFSVWFDVLLVIFIITKSFDIKRAAVTRNCINIGRLRIPLYEVKAQKYKDKYKNSEAYSERLKQ